MPAARQRVHADDPARHQGADVHAGPEGDEGDEALGGGAQVRGRLAVHVDLPGHEEEVVADAVEEDADVQHPYQAGVVAEGEEQVARGPRGHPDEHHLLHAEPGEEERHYEHEADLGRLAESHLAGCVDHAQLVEEEVREGVVKLERDAYQEGAEDEDGEGALLQEHERVEPEHVAHADLLAPFRRRGVGQR